MNKNKPLIYLLILINSILTIKCILNYNKKKELDGTATQTAIIEKADTSLLKEFEVLGKLDIHNNQCLIQTPPEFSKTAQSLFFTLKKSSLAIKKITLSPQENRIIIDYEPQI